MPLALALLNASNPGLGAMDALSRLSHDTDAEVAQNAVVALGARLRLYGRTCQLSLRLDQQHSPVASGVRHRARCFMHGACFGPGEQGRPLQGSAFEQTVHAYLHMLSRLMVASHGVVQGLVCLEFRLSASP